LEVESHGGGMVYFFVLLGYVNFYE
jgi:hypothetical protein